MIDTTTGAPAHRGVRRIRRETRPIRGNLVVAGVLLGAFVIYTWLVVEWSPFVRLDFFLNRNYHVHSLWPLLHVLDRIGQRAVCLPTLTVVIAVTAWRHRSWRPILLGVIGVFSVNLLVLIVKLALSRGAPLSGTSFFSDGDLYPSGHTANILVVYGLCFHLITHYGHVSDRVRRILVAVVCLLAVLMFTTSLLLRWHWFSDLIGGFMIGGAVLALTVGIDAAIPFRSHKLVVIAPRPPPQPSEPLSSAADAMVVTSARVSWLRRLHGSPAAAGDRPSRH